ncbi:MAG: glycosyltransferase family 2 protein [Candidatus Thorarchaeota archaeon]
MEPRISVIIPTYNEEANIEKTLLAVKNQICEFPYEIMVADGQSSDNTVLIAKKLSNVCVSPKKGKAFQLNFAVPKTSGEILLFLDADTLIGPYFLQRVYKKFQRHKNLFACSARIKYNDKRAIKIRLGPFIFTITKYFFHSMAMAQWYFFKSLFGYPELSGTNMIVRRDIFFEAGGFKHPPNSLGIDKVFTDSIIYVTRKMKRGKIKALNFISVFTSGRHLTIERSMKRINLYRTKKNIYYDLAKKNELAS